MELVLLVELLLFHLLHQPHINLIYLLLILRQFLQLVLQFFL